MHDYMKTLMQGLMDWVLSVFATKEYVERQGYLTAVPDEYVTESELLAKGYLTEHQDISGKLDASALTEGINTALAQAKASGEFDGAPGYSPVRGTDYWTAADIATIKGYVDDAILGGAW